jgi:Cupredoxin-like domain
MTKTTSKRKNEQRRRVPEIWYVVGGTLAVCVLVLGGWVISRNSLAARSTEAPEAGRVLDIQADMPFQVLIPAYLPKEIDRAGMQISINQSGPSGEPMAHLAYRTKQGAKLFVQEWVPGNPAMEILANSSPIQTKWGPGWLLKQKDSLIAIWVDVGPLRLSIYTPNPDVLPQEQLLAIAETMGPASNQQVFNFIAEPPVVQGIPPPPPFEVETNEQGVQEFTLVVTPGGYSPLRFAVRKGVPVRMTFRQLGQVGCGNELIFPADPVNLSALQLASPGDEEVLEFTPPQAGSFEFYCGHQMYRGIMTVRE